MTVRKPWTSYEFTSSFSTVASTLVRTMSLGLSSVDAATCFGALNDDILVVHLGLLERLLRRVVEVVEVIVELIGIWKMSVVRSGSDVIEFLEEVEIFDVEGWEEKENGEREREREMNSLAMEGARKATVHGKGENLNSKKVWVSEVRWRDWNIKIKP